VLNGERQPKGERKQAEIDLRPLSNNWIHSSTLVTERIATEGSLRKIGHHHWPVALRR